MNIRVSGIQWLEVCKILFHFMFPYYKHDQDDIYKFYIGYVVGGEEEQIVREEEKRAERKEKKKKKKLK